MTQFISFLLLPLYTRYLGASDYGVLSLVLVYSACVSFVAELGFVSGIMRFYPMRTGRDAEALMSTAIWTLLIIGAGVLGLAFYWRAGVGAWILPGETEAAYWVTLATLTAVMTPTGKAVLRTFQLRKQPLHFVGASLVQFLTNVSVTLYLVVIENRGVEGVLLGQVSGQAVLFSLSLLVHVRFLICRPCSEAFETLVGFSLPLVPANLSALVIGLSDRFFLERMASLKDVGVYAVADKMALVLQVLLVTSFANAWHQFVFTHQKDEQLQKTFAATSRVYGSLFLFVLVAFSFVMPELLTLATTPEFLEGYRLVPILCIGPLVQGWVLFSYDGIHLAGKTRMIPLILGTGMVANLVLNTLLIPPLGMIGAALATALSMLLIGSWAHSVSARLYPVNYPVGHILKVAAAASMTLIAFFIFDPQDVWISRGLRLTLFALFASALWFLELFGRKELDAAVSPIRKRLGL